MVQWHLSRLRFGLSTHLGGLPFECQAMKGSSAKNVVNRSDAAVNQIIFAKW